MKRYGRRPEPARADTREPEKTASVAIDAGTTPATLAAASSQPDPDRLFAELVAVLTGMGEVGRRRVARLLAAYDEPEASPKGADVVPLRRTR